MPRRRRPAVSSEERARWLEKLERGEGVTAIAKGAGRDIRVVKRYIEIAQQEREAGRARLEFLRSRLEQHQDDLLGEVTRLRAAASVPPAHSLEPADVLKRKMYEALMEHVRRLSLWRLIEEYKDAAARYQEAHAGVKQQLEGREADLLSTLPPGTSTYPWADRLVDGLHSRVWRGSSLEREYLAMRQEDGSGYRLSWGEFILTRSPVSMATLTEIKQLHQQLRSAAESLLPVLQGHVPRLAELSRQIRDELDVFILRRLVPGRCRYCPV